MNRRQLLKLLPGIAVAPVVPVVEEKPIGAAIMEAALARPSFMPRKYGSKLRLTQCSTEDAIALTTP